MRFYYGMTFWDHEDYELVVYFQSDNWFEAERFIQKNNFVNKITKFLSETKKDIDWWHGEHYYIGAELKPIISGGQDYLSFDVFSK